MKAKLFSLILAGLFLISGSKDLMAQVSVDVYYFHITNRCNTCISIEKEIHNTLQTYFADKVKDSTIRLFVINCELPENKAISEKYLAYGSTLAITRHAQGKEAIQDITGWAFQKVGNPGVFQTELKSKIEDALKP